MLAFAKWWFGENPEFRSPKYIGDPINAVRILNEKKADELFVLDINATVDGERPDYDLIKKISSECRMPFLLWRWN